MNLRLKLKKYLIILAPIIGILIAMVILPNFVNLNTYKEKIASSIDDKMHAKVEINGDIKFKILPSPILEINNIKIESTDGKKITAQSLKLLPNLWQILLFKFVPERITLDHATIEILSIGDYLTGENIITSLELIDSNLIITESEIFKEISNINAVINHEGNGKKLNIESKFDLFKQNYFLNAKFDDIDNQGNSDNATFSLGTSNLAAEFTGNLKSLFQAPDLDGNLELKITSSQAEKSNNKFINYLILDNLKAASKFQFNKHFMNISNIAIDSSSLKNAKGDLNVQFKNLNEFNANLSVDKLDLDVILKDVESFFKENSNLEESLKLLLESFDFQIPKSLDGNGDLTINEIKYNGESAKNFKFSINYFDGEIFIDELAFNLPNSSNLKISGSVSHNLIRPKFEGSINLNLNNIALFTKWLKLDNIPPQIAATNKISLTSQMSIIPRTLRLNDFQLGYDNKSFSGKCMIKNTGENKLYSKIALKVNELDLNELDISNTIDNFILKLYLYDQDKTGEYFINSIDDYTWLRRFPITLYIDLSTNKLYYKNLQFEKSNFLFKVAPNKIELDKIEVDSDYLSFNLNGKVKINIMTPEVNFMMDVKKLYYPVLNLLLPSLEKLKQTRDDIYKNAADKKLSINLPDFAPEIDMNFFSMQNFNSNFKINIKDLIIDNENSWSNIGIKGSIQDGIFSLENLSGNAFDGKINLYGNTIFITQVPTFRYSFSLASIDPSKLFNFCCGYNSLSGYMSVVGNFTTDGYSAKTFFSKMYADLNFAAKKLTFNGFDIGEIIRISESDDLLLSVKLDKLKEASNSGKSMFDDAVGKGVIKAGIMSLNNISFSNKRVRGSYSFGYDVQENLINGLSRILFIPQGNVLGLTLDTTNTGNLTSQEFKIDSSKVVDFLNKKDEKNVRTPAQSVFKH